MDNSSARDKFRELHREGCFVIPNPWDIGSAKRLEAMGFQALASTSGGAASALGRDDGQMTRSEVLQHVAMLCEATNLPVNADFEAGFADTPEELEKSVALLIQTGVAGFSIEDYQGPNLYDSSEAVERIRAARKAIDRSGENVLLVARSEGFIRGRPDLQETLRRLKLYSEAGADCLYAPGVTELSSIREIVESVAPKPVNVLLMPGLRVSDLAGCGVRRVSVGSSLARAAWCGFEHAALMLRDEGTLPK
ncbi:MAG: methylisocitrate lyase [Acidobacteriales bacterium]|nr:methylisocitrate lyase [Terriglobales bacterium]